MRGREGRACSKAGCVRACACAVREREKGSAPCTCACVRVVCVYGREIELEVGRPCICRRVKGMGEGETLYVSGEAARRGRVSEREERACACVPMCVREGGPP